MEAATEVQSVSDDIATTVDRLRNSAFLDSCRSDLDSTFIEFELSSSELPSLTEESGIYLFWANFSEWISEHKWEEVFQLFLDQWSNPINAIQYYPRFNQTRAKKTLAEYSHGDWIPFYLGKGKNIKNRVHQHITLEGRKKTYALKLNAMKESLFNINFSVSALKIPLDEKSYFLLELIEAELRTLYNPIIGKQ